MKAKQVISWILQIGVAIIYLQTLFFKFTANPESVKLFTMLGAEPYGRLSLGVIELMIAIGILLPGTIVISSIISSIIMLGAIMTHLLIIGINFNNDGGTLFVLALITLIASITIIILKNNFKDKTI